MKKIAFIFSLFFTLILSAQSTGSVLGKLTDKEYNNEPLVFANVLIKGSSTGTTSDFDGLYQFQNLKPGPATLVFSFIGYKTQEIPVTIVAGEVTEINTAMGASTAKLDEVVIVTTAKKESETALLMSQKKAVLIKESIGFERLSKMGISDAANATTKISGVAKSEGSGEVYIRGLGDRYLTTTLNGLPMPSDDVNNKNINLNVFATNIIENIGITKTYATSSYADQSSGTVDITTKGYSKKSVSINVSTGYNTNVIGLDHFKRSIISKDVTLGFHKKQFAVVDLITKQGWDPSTKKNTGNYGLSLSGGVKFDLFGKPLKVFVVGSHSKANNYQEGLFRSFRSNILDNEFTDTELFTTHMNTTGYTNLDVKLANHHSLRLSSLSVNKSSDRIYEQGRNGQGYVFDQDPQENGAFVRDQNFKQTTLLVNQLEGCHKLGDTHDVKWAVGYNYVLAQEPNRIRNEVNILDANTVQYAHVGDFQQRKSSQKIEDTEYNAYVSDVIEFTGSDANNDSSYKLHVGTNFRQKSRAFGSLFVGVRARDFQTPSVADLSQTFTTENFNNGLVLRERKPDRYDAELNVISGYANIDFSFIKKVSGNAGIRFESDEMTVLWDVANYVGRVGSIKKQYTKLYPSIHLKYTFSDQQFIRLASSLTQTLPEFKELAPFEYVSPTGRVTRGDPNLEKSDILNLDLKWEFFPNPRELISLTTFYKNIKNPINLAQARGSAGIFQYANTGNEATVFGLEFETRLDLLKNEEQESLLNFNTNITKMWFAQDLLDVYQFKNLTKTDLQGASDFIFNGSISYNNQKEKSFKATVTGNFSSDKIFALGSPEDFANSALLFNDHIIEKAFVSLDLVVSKQITDKLYLNFVGRNLLNPQIEQTQLITRVNTNVETNEIVSSYKKGSLLSLSLKYTF